jgi:hypothetical protein
VVLRATVRWWQPRTVDEIEGIRHTQDYHHGVDTSSVKRPLVYAEAGLVDIPGGVARVLGFGVRTTFGLGGGVGSACATRDCTGISLSESPRPHPRGMMEVLGSGRLVLTGGEAKPVVSLLCMATLGPPLPYLDHAAVPKCEPAGPRSCHRKAGVLGQGSRGVGVAVGVTVSSTASSRT